MAERPYGLRVGRKQNLILPAGIYQKPEVARPRKRGLGGKPPVSAAAGWALTEGGPLAHLKVNCPRGAREGGLGHWLLSVRAESNTRPHKNKKLIHIFIKACGQKTGT